MTSEYAIPVLLLTFPAAPPTDISFTENLSPQTPNQQTPPFPPPLNSSFILLTNSVGRKAFKHHIKFLF
jgi:hypothetical protein